MSDLKNIIEGVITGSSDQKRSTGTPGNDNFPKEGSTPASKAPKMKGKPAGPPPVATDPEVKNKDAAKVAHQTKQAKKPAPKVAGGDSSQPAQGSSKEATPDNKKLGEEEELMDSDEELYEEEEEEEDTIELPESKAGMAKLVFDMLRSMDKEDLDERYISILSAILNEGSDDDDDVEVDEESSEMVEDARTRITADDIDVSDDVAALLSSDEEGEALSEDFINKATTIFEAAVVSKVNTEIDRLEEDFKVEVSEARQQYEQEMTNKVDGYLSYVVEEWMKENELAVERGIRSELTEDFITGLKDLFTQHYIEIPDEKVDVVDNLAERVAQLESELNESIELNIDLHKALGGHEKEEILYSLSDGLADTEFEKLKGLAEGVEFEDTEQYQQALVTLKEGYFPRAPRTIEQEDTDELLSESLSQGSSSMDVYTNAIGRTVRN